MKLLPIYLTCSFILFVLSTKNANAQIGINEESPEATLHIKLAKEDVAAFNVDNESGANIFYMDKDGNIGLGNNAPNAKLDLRPLGFDGSINSIGLSKDNSIGIGYTSMDASEAEAGALRYNPSIEKFEYSDGVNWISMEATDKKAFVVANNSSGLSYTYDPVARPNAIAGVIMDWTTIIDDENNFDGSKFIAPRDGLYSISTTVVFEKSTMAKSGQYEISLNGTNAGSLKCVVTYPGGNSTMPYTNTCSAMFPLKAGGTLSVSFYMNLVSGNQKLSSDASLNSLTIIEM